MEVLPDLMPQEPLRSVRFSESNTVIPTPLESNSSSETVGSGATTESTEMVGYFTDSSTYLRVFLQFLPIKMIEISVEPIKNLNFYYKNLFTQ